MTNGDQTDVVRISEAETLCDYPLLKLYKLQWEHLEKKQIWILNASVIVMLMLKRISMIWTDISNIFR